MDFLEVFFPISGVKTYIFIPPLVALVVSFFCSMGGVSGAFLLLPFQVSFLGFTSPAVSSTNMLYNVVAIPSGVLRYIKEGRMAWPLTLIIVIGTVPGILIGYYLRILYLPDPRAFKFFVGLVLLGTGIRLLYDLTGRARRIKSRMRTLEDKFERRRSAGLPSEAVVKKLSSTFWKTRYEFWDERFSFDTVAMFLLSFSVGIIGGVYGIGGGSIIAPICVSVFRLPVYTVAGATLMATFSTSVIGVLFYTFIPSGNDLQTSPDWLLGLLFGVGGVAGMYLGARFQKYVPQKFIKSLLSLLILFVAARYLMQYFG